MLALINIYHYFIIFSFLFLIYIMFGSSFHILLQLCCFVHVNNMTQTLRLVEVLLWVANLFLSVSLIMNKFFINYVITQTIKIKNKKIGGSVRQLANSLVNGTDLEDLICHPLFYICHPHIFILTKLSLLLFTDQNLHFFKRFHFY